MTEELDLTGFGDEKDLEGGDYFTEGKFHVAVTAVEVDPIVEIDGQQVQKSEVCVKFQGLAGTAPAEGRILNETFPKPSPNHKDKGKFCNQRLARLALATGLINPADLGQRKQIDWTALTGRQLVIGVKVEHYDRKDKSGQPTGEKGSKSKLNGLEIWSVRDPAVVDVPKDAEMLEYAAAQFPTPAASEGAAKPTNNGPANTAVTPARQQPKAAAATTTDPYANV